MRHRVGPSGTADEDARQSWLAKVQFVVGMRQPLREVTFALQARDLRLPDCGRMLPAMETEPPYRIGMNRPVRDHQVRFDRSELSLILSIYGRMVALGEWRDYGISHLSDVAIFSIFRRTADMPLYRVEKRPKLAQRQGAYAVIGMDGRVLKRGQDLRRVLGVLERKLIRVVS